MTDYNSIKNTTGSEAINIPPSEEAEEGIADLADLSPP